MSLNFVGISGERIRKVVPTEQTARFVQEMYRLVSPQEQYDVRTLVTLRVAGEVLIGESYACIAPELERRGWLTEEQSQFYWPHWQHDIKRAAIGKYGPSHSDQFSRVLARKLDSEESLRVARESMDAAYRVEAGFFDQFGEYVTKNHEKDL